MKNIKKSYHYIKNTGRLFLKKETPFLYKLIPIGAIAYILFPLDIIADFIPVFGQMDDAAILFGALGAFNTLAKPEIKV